MNRPTAIAYIDMLSCLFAFFVIVFVISYNIEKNKDGVIDDPAQFLIVLEWENGSHNDIDLIVKNPNDKVVWYKIKNIDGMTLDRDDMGLGGNYDPIRREVTSIRTLQEGEYIVNILFYSDKGKIIENTKVKVIKLNPYEEIYEGEYKLTFRGEEHTLVSFVIDKDGKVVSKDVNTQSHVLKKASVN